MGFFGGDSSEAQAYDQFSSGNVHKSDISHELLAGAASFAAAREYEKHCEKNGKPASHAEAKELLSAFAGAFIDKEVESHGLDFVDKEKAKYDAHKRASEVVAVDYA
ncbi:hypothetical protein B0H16DRAFT_143319 [Mycena metata]|uniref:CipC protein n=1 Tax=Mycena metata TaxID=1033252 RepID=A0AAD7NSG6_9AGAR|nr:hypothetical protein B0H16DRAFT_143319 [Mycena metata]